MIDRERWLPGRCERGGRDCIAGRLRHRVRIRHRGWNACWENARGHEVSNLQRLDHVLQYGDDMKSYVTSPCDACLSRCPRGCLAGVCSALLAFGPMAKVPTSGAAQGEGQCSLQSMNLSYIHLPQAQMSSNRLPPSSLRHVCPSQHRNRDDLGRAAGAHVRPAGPASVPRLLRPRTRRRSGCAGPQPRHTRDGDTGRTGRAPADTGSGRGARECTHMIAECALAVREGDSVIGPLMYRRIAMQNAPL